MRRRDVLRSLGATGSLGVIALAGCIEDEAQPEDDPFASGDGGVDDNDSDNEGTPEGDPTLLDTELNEYDCVDVEVSFGDDTVEVVGCVTGNNGCHRPKLEEASLDGDAFTVTVKSEDPSEPDEMCTDVITDNGYQVIATFDGGLPATVEVIHKDMYDDGTVATAER